jgi:hemoglobin-like flavoprotein
MDIPLLRSSFDQLKPQADDLAQRFYARLFSTYPQVRPLFRTNDFAEQRRKLMASVAAVVSMVDRPEQLRPVLATMGRQHAELGVQPRQYDFVRASMLAAMADSLGERWTAELSHTWDEALRFVSDEMCAGARAAAPVR